MSDRLLKVAKELSETPTDYSLPLDATVHIRDLKTAIKRLLEYIDSNK